MTDPQAALVRKLTWRLMPLLTVGYFVAVLDRPNIGVLSLWGSGPKPIANVLRKAG